MKRRARFLAASLTSVALTIGGVSGFAGMGCATMNLRAAVTMQLKRVGNTPRDASVIIDEQYIGPLTYVAAHGVRLPVGEHRITVQKPGYFPWDRLVEADREPIHLEVELVPIPD
jgi:hypothetical protein